MADLDNVKFSFVENKKQMSNFTLDAGVKRAFKLEVIKNGDIMSKVIETLMASYVVKSKQLHAEAEAKTSKDK